jgi:hypothetical protein
MVHVLGRNSFWKRCLNTRRALLNGDADQQLEQRTYWFVLALAGAGCIMVTVSIVGLLLG